MVLEVHLDLEWGLDLDYHNSTVVKNGMSGVETILEVILLIYDLFSYHWSS